MIVSRKRLVWRVGSPSAGQLFLIDGVCPYTLMTKGAREIHYFSLDKMLGLVETASFCAIVCASVLRRGEIGSL
jgi:hypothetical protein